MAKAKTTKKKGGKKLPPKFLALVCDEVDIMNADHFKDLATDLVDAHDLEEVVEYDGLPHAVPSDNYYGKIAIILRRVGRAEDHTYRFVKVEVNKKSVFEMVY